MEIKRDSYLQQFILYRFDGLVKEKIIYNELIIRQFSGGVGAVYARNIN